MALFVRFLGFVHVSIPVVLQPLANSLRHGCYDHGLPQGLSPSRHACLQARNVRVQGQGETSLASFLFVLRRHSFISLTGSSDRDTDSHTDRPLTIKLRLALQPISSFLISHLLAPTSITPPPPLQQGSTRHPHSLTYPSCPSLSYHP